jgi:hypothetical protein
MSGEFRDNWPVRIGDRRYVVEMAALEMGPLSLLRQHIDTEAEASERSFDNQGIWKRYRTSFVQGAGQEWLDDGADANPERFRSSRHLSIDMERGFEMLPTTTEVKTATDGARQWLFVAGTRLIWIHGQDCSVWNGSAWNDVSIGNTGDATGASIAHNKILVATTSETLRAATLADSPSFATLGATTPDVLGYGAGRLLAGEGADLYELDSAGASTALITHDNDQFAWQMIEAAPNGFYCAGDNEFGGEIWLTTANDTGALDKPIPIATMPDGEFTRTIRFYGEAVIIGTTEGVRVGVVQNDGSLVFGKRIFETADAVLSVEPQDRYCWIPWVVDGEGHGLIKLDLGRFIEGEDLVPAYFEDLFVEDSSNDLEVHGVVTYGGVRWWCGKDNTAAFVRTQHATQRSADTAYLETGKITYGTPEDKSFFALDVEWDPLPAGSAVVVKVRADDGDSWTTVLGSSSQGSTKERGFIDPAILGPQLEIRIELTRAGNLTDSPRIRHWTLKAMPVPFKPREFILPVQLGAKVGAGTGNRGVPMTVYDEVQYLMGLEETQEPFIFEFGDYLQMAVVDEVRVTRTREITRTPGWDATKSWPEGALYVRVVTIDIDPVIEG